MALARAGIKTCPVDARCDRHRAPRRAPRTPSLNREGFKDSIMAVIHVTNRAGKTQTITGKVGHTLMEILRDAGHDVEAVCGGCCSCATCHVFVDEAWLGKIPARTLDESELVEQTRAYKGN